MTSPPRILLDLTPLDTPSGPRGIGRYIRELAIGLSELPARELEGIEIVGLTSLGWTGECEIHATSAPIAADRARLADGDGFLRLGLSATPCLVARGQAGPRPSRAHLRSARHAALSRPVRRPQDRHLP